jgi:phage-related protein
MAGEVGSVYITVRAITDKVSGDIEKAFSNVNTGSIASSGAGVGKAFSDAAGKGMNANIFNKVGEALSNLGGEAGSAREEMAGLTMKGYNLGTAFVTILGAVSSLIGGFGGLAGAALGAAPAMLGLLGSLLSLKAGLAVGELAFQGIAGAVQSAISQSQSYRQTLAQLTKQHQDLAFASENAQNAVNRAAIDLEKARNNLIRMQDLPPNSLQRREAMQSYKEAETAYRQAKARAADAKKEAANPLAFKTPKADPYAGLSPAQKDFAKWLVSIQGQFMDLKDAAASGFLPILKKNLQDIIDKVLPTFKTGVHEIAVGLGGLTTNLTAAITDPGNVKLLGEVMHNIASDLPTIGTILGNVYGSFLIILKESHPLVTNFLNFLNTKTKSMEDWLKAKAASGEMKAFFARSEKIMQDLGVIFDNVLGTLGAIIGANFEPGSGGDIMIQWLKKVTGGWAAMDDTIKGKNALKQYFIDTAKNSTAILDAIGALVKQFLILGQNQNIGATFKAMADPAAVKAVGDIAKQLADAGPSLGKLVADITIFIDKMTDTQAIKNFFDTIDGFVKFVTAVLDNPIAGPILKILGQIHGVFLGIMVSAKATGFISKYLGESLDLLKKFSFKNIKDGMETIALKGMYAKDKFVELGSKAKDAFETIALKGMYAKDKMVELGAKGVDAAKNAASAFANWGKQMGTYVVESIKTAGTAIGDLSKKIALNTIEIVKNIGQWIAQKAALVASTIAQTAMKVATAIATGVQAAFNFVMGLNPIVLITIAVAALVAGLVIFFTQTEVGKKVWGDFMNFMGDVWKNITGFFQGAWDWLTKNWPTVLAILTGPIGLAVLWISTHWSEVTKFFSAVFTAVAKWAKDTWDGFIKGIGTFITWVSKGLAPIGKFFETAFNGIGSFFKTIINTMIGYAENFINFWLRGINNIIRALNTLKIDVPKGVPFIGGTKFGINIPLIPEIKLPRLAKGGTVMPSMGGSLVNVAEAGRPERIEPLDANGLSNRDKALISFLSGGTAGKSIQMNIYPSAGMSEQDLAAAVSRQLAFELRRGGM